MAAPRGSPLMYLPATRAGDPQLAYMMNGNGVPTLRVVNTEEIVPDFTAQHGSHDGNYSLVKAYEYALNHPTDPAGPLPAAVLGVVLTAFRVGRYAP